MIAAIIISGCSSGTSSSSSSTTVKSEPAAAKTEIIGKGIRTTISIAPSNGNVISGVVTITATKVPSDIGVMGFSIQGGNVPEDPSTSNIALHTDGSSGWDVSLDTTKYDNGAYEISIVAGSADFKSMLGSASADVVIKN